MATLYEIYRILGPGRLARHVRNVEANNPAYVAELATNLMTKRRWYGVAARPEGQEFGPWSYLDVRDADPHPTGTSPPPPALVPLPMRDNPVAVREGEAAAVAVRTKGEPL